MMTDYIVSIKYSHHRALRWNCRNGVSICLSHLMIDGAKARGNNEPLNEHLLMAICWQVLQMIRLDCSGLFIA